MKRYVMTMDMYIYADNDKGALELAQYITDKQKMKWDNQANTTSLKEAPFGSFVPGKELMDNSPILSNN